jgi:hypothetical protein
MVWLTIWSPITVFYSDNWNNWNTLTTTNIIDIEWSPYAEFTTNHFTYFAVSNGTWWFFINSWDSYTTTQNVTLDIDVSTATHMRFSNDGSNRSSRETYATTYPRTLSNWFWSKTVYAEFDLNNDQIADASTYETIIYIETTNGNISLTLTGWKTECVYWTSLNLGAQNVKINQTYNFTGTFSGDRYCADYDWLSSGWTFNITTTDLSNENWSIISGSNVLISHDTPILEWHSSCTGYNWVPTTFNTGLTLIEKAEGVDNNKICKITLQNVDLQINVPANQAPGNYSGTITIDIPNEFPIY